MKKLLLTLILGLFLTASINAEEHNNPDEQVQELPGMFWEHFPSICVNNETLIEFTKRKKLDVFNVSYGKAGGKEDGEIVYIVTYWVDFVGNNTMATVTTPSSSYSCVLFRTFDVQVNPNLYQPRLDT